MQLSPEERILVSIKSLLKNSLGRLKDEEYQRKIWFATDGPFSGSYSDACIHFIDRCENIFENPMCYEFLETENYFILKNLYRLISDHLDSVELRMDADLIQTDQLLNDPKWHDIQTLAGKVEVKLTELLERKSKLIPRTLNSEKRSTVCQYHLKK